jgi:cell division protein FtsI/penicillin-binding protein 2
MAFRFLALILLFTALFGALGFRLYQLQIQHGAEYVSRVHARSELAEGTALRRGQILFTNRSGVDIPVAQNRDFPYIYAVPSEITDPEGTARVLAPLIGQNEAALTTAISNPDNKFRRLVDQASADVVQAVNAAKLQGIYTDAVKQYRAYPFQRLGAHILGFVGFTEKQTEPIGLYGTERFRDETLAAGNDVRLLIDRDLQEQAEQSLGKLVDQYSATLGTIIIQDSRTGAILALASKPDFDPNTYGESPVKNFQDPAIQYQYEPGSVMKPFTMLAGIDSGVLASTTTFLDTGSVTMNGKTITNYDGKAYGRITMTNVLEHSVNTGAVFAEKKVGHDRFYNYLLKLGFGEKTGIDLPDEIVGSLRNLQRKNAQAIDFANASFGQGTAVTPVQLVTAFSALANGGLLMRPYMTAEEKPYVVRRVASEAAAHEVALMLESAVKVNSVAVIPGYRVAGKTGTANIPENGVYTEDLNHTFVGFAPVSNPRFTILVRLERPQSVGALAGMTVVPAFRDLMQYTLTTLHVPPDSVGEVSL